MYENVFPHTKCVNVFLSQPDQHGWSVQVAQPNTEYKKLCNQQNELWREQQAWALLNPYTPSQGLGMPSTVMVSIWRLAMGITFLLLFDCILQLPYCPWVVISVYCWITPLNQNPM